MMSIKCAVVVAVLLMAGDAGGQPQRPNSSFGEIEASIDELRGVLAAGDATAHGLVEKYLAHIDRHEKAFSALVSLNAAAATEARRLDDERGQGRARGPLHGIPILLKDNIDAKGLVTTAGSLALAENVAVEDAEVVRRLVDSGAIVLGKANLSEWANFRSRWSSSGWSAVGGLTRNAYARERSACGSSSGSAVAVAMNYAAAAVGTETDGSITCPAAVNGIVGLKPTVGLVSRRGIVPISDSQDTAGPMTRTVMDAALLLNAMVGADPTDPATAEADAHRRDYAAALDARALQGKNIGVLRFLAGHSPPTDLVFDRSLEVLRHQGAELVEIAQFDFGPIGRHELTVLLTEFKVGINHYLASTPPAVRTRTLADLIEFNRTEPRELEWFGQDLFEQAQATGGLDDPAYLEARETARRMAGPEGIDRLLREHDVVALVAPTVLPAWSIDLVNGDRSIRSASTLPAVAGYPHLTVPMGQVAGLPVGLSFIGAKWSEADLLSLGFAFEQATQARRPPVPGGEEM